jgi:prephenate dehydrogenase
MNDALKSSCVAIVGLGLMGGSMAMALKGKCGRLLGIDGDLQVVALAQQLGLVDQARSEATGILGEAEVIILATPVRTILQMLRELPGLHPGRARVLDLGSTKEQIVEAMAELPERFDPIGGHPMCGKELSSLANAEATLFQGATFALVPLPRTSPGTRQLAEEIVGVVGAKPVWIDAESHDAWAAATSHLPYLLANALAAATPPETRPLVGPGWRSSARLAATPDHMMIDILATNRANVLRAMERFEERLGKLKEYLQNGNDEPLKILMQQGAQNYLDFVSKEASQ